MLSNDLYFKCDKHEHRHSQGPQLLEREEKKPESSLTNSEDIYFLSFERSELEGKYSLIVSVYACMHCVWEIIVCCHNGDAGLCVYVACMDGLAQLVGI